MSHRSTDSRIVADRQWLAITPTACDVYVSVLNRFRGKDASMYEDDRSYYQRRAEAEIERAQLATVPSAVQAHYKLAEAYFSKLASNEPVKVEAS
jgi:hypothetical protein